MKKLFALSLASLLISVLTSAFYIPLSYGHSGDLIYVEWMVVRPTIDGIISPGEWDDAYKIRFISPTHTYSWIGHTGPHTWYGYFKLDEYYLYIAIDAVDDTYDHANDWAGFLFDINHNGVMDGGWGFPRAPGEDLVWIPDWRFSDADHARGFSSSPDSPTPHRIYEIRFPLAFNPMNGLGTSPGRTLGFASLIQDTFVCEYIWPVGASLSDPGTWADLILPPLPVGGRIIDISAGETYGGGSYTAIAITALIAAVAASLTIIKHGGLKRSNKAVKHPKSP